MPRTVERTVYKFSELSESAKEHARDTYREHGQHDDWWDSVYEDAVACSKCLGIDIDIDTGFHSQGDGAMFTGRYNYKADACAAIAAHAPQDEELATIAAELTLMQLTARLQHAHQLEARVTNSGYSNYCHSGCMDVTANYVDGNDEAPDVEQAVEKDLTDLMRRFADWIYAQLRKEDEYLNSDEHVDECLADDEFDEDGDVV